MVKRLLRGNLSDQLPEALRKILAEFPEVSIAFSGGLDSRFLCHAAQLCGCKVVAIHIAGSHVPARDSAFAETWARKNSLPFISVPFNPLEVPEIAANDKERCYFCKKAILNKIKSVLKKHNVHDYPLCDGGNKDDLAEYRPGNRAVKESGVLSPLARAGLGKREIKYFAALTGMEKPFQLARPCLLTRFAYGVRPSEEKLKKIEEIESSLDRLLSKSTGAEVDFRLRFLPNPELHIARIHQNLEPYIREILKLADLENCPIIPMDKVSGYHDKTWRLQNRTDDTS